MSRTQHAESSLALPIHTIYEEILAILCLPCVLVRHRVALEKLGKELLCYLRRRHIPPSDAPCPVSVSRHHNMVTPIKGPHMDRYRH
ncbi:hypothetical protein E2C01_076354 [Portunus trituberculatus]|uniref:Uncharacterized protein n=1 Tax=Portunus trituberculatus TaxID=210409 RepID=A0A5B7IHG9_PORTR|nr:hypothetical protein [Portunus trituberculatus]